MADIDRISELHDDLLLKILSQVPTKKAVTTMVLSKRWGLVWTMVPKLKYKDTRKEGDKSVWCLINKSLQLHKACVLESLCIQVNHQFSKAEDVGKCVSYAVDHCVRELSLDISSLSQIVLLPPNVYASKTLVELILAGHRLVVDVPSLPCLPSLQKLILICVMYKDQNSHVRLLENCPALRHLDVLRDMSDNVSRFIVKVPSLNSFTYMQTGLIGDSGSRSWLQGSPTFVEPTKFCTGMLAVPSRDLCVGKVWRKKKTRERMCGVHPSKLKVFKDGENLSDMFRQSGGEGEDGGGLKIYV
ncbi:FBD domain family [Raphanus sativus]|nr:FBD domain family [Raphanus sativus]